MAESLISLDIESLTEGGYVATSSDLPGLVAQGRTIAECMEIAQDVARKLVESYLERGDPLPLKLRALTPGKIGVEIPVGIP
jgi:predicted RNase H-like HicB family nuclease